MRSLGSIFGALLLAGVVACETPADLYILPTGPHPTTASFEATMSSDSVEWTDDELAFVYEGNHYRARRLWDDQERVAAIDLWINHVYEVRLVADYTGGDSEITKYRVYDPVIGDPGAGDPTTNAPWIEANRYDQIVRTSVDEGGSGPGDEPPGDPCDDQVDPDPWCEDGFAATTSEDEEDCEEELENSEKALEDAMIGGLGGGAGSAASYFVRASLGATFAKATLAWMFFHTSRATYHYGMYQWCLRNQQEEPDDPEPEGAIALISNTGTSCEVASPSASLWLVDRPNSYTPGTPDRSTFPEWTS